MKRLPNAVLKFYSLVVASTLTDMALLVGLLWAALKISGSPILLGAVLALSAIVPFSLRKLFPRLNTARLSFAAVLLFRGACYLVLLGMAWADLFDNLSGFVVAAMIVGLLNFVTASAFEAANTKLVIGGLVGSHVSAKWMQTASQLGAFSGSFMGGLLLEHAGMSVLVLLAAALALVTNGLGLLTKVGPPSPVAAGTAASGQGAASTSQLSDGSLYLLCIALGMIGFHIGSFNTLTPVIYQGLNGWTSADFGLASGVAGVGAFAAALLPTPKIHVLFFALLIVLADAVLAFAPLPVVSIGVCVLIGFGINHIRIHLRKSMIELARDSSEADHIAALSSVFFILFQSAGPLVLGLAVSSHGWGANSARPLFVILGALLFTAVALTGLLRARRAATLQNAH